VILYLDTSSLLKCYIDEEHSGAVRAWLTAAAQAATSRVSLPEAAAALGRRHRQGDLTASGLRGAMGAVKADWSAYAVVDVDEHLAAALALRRSLRGFDAVHLAAALTLLEGLGHDQVAFTSFDDALNEAARREGLLVLTPAED